MLRIVGVLQVVGEQMERFLAATLSTARISFGEAVDTHAPTASGLVQFVDTVSVVVVNVVLGDAAQSCYWLDGRSRICVKLKNQPKHLRN